MGHSQRSNCFDCVKEPTFDQLLQTCSTFSPYDMPIWRRLHLMFAKLITCFNRKRSFRLLYQPTEILLVKDLNFEKVSIM
ncbi:hypothetical protein T03_5945 [Trichinella britovi]|uniref:Uncharacterized protein n=2 Tax=Trichinella TaxID=6333 RepID=A0A0V1CA80_TRIBR|nr:hypothetical protein T12_15039 [Trichinella patagoniensis]KRY45820.1 hypothetical protein T03_5945 [Trichinella britovi]KRZ84005.1 hypothetical protein T08_10075 [Trichinella sp. T8]